MNTKNSLRVAATAALLVALASSGNIVKAQAQGQGAVAAGTWFLTTPAGLTEFVTFHQDRTVTGVASVAFGGLPNPGRNRSGDHGVWGHVGEGLFAFAFYRYQFDPVTGDATEITRVRSVFRLDPGHESASGEFLIANWACPTATTCPDPNETAPDVEFAPPGNTLTMTRMRLP